jgi:hypothetical protein
LDAQKSFTDVNKDGNVNDRVHSNEKASICKSGGGHRRSMKGECQSPFGKMSKKQSLTGELIGRVIITGWVPLNHLLILEEPLCNKPKASKFLHR